MRSISTLLLTFLCTTSFAQTGSPVSAFGTNGNVFSPIGTGYDEARAVAVQSDGKIVMAGYSYNGTSYDFTLARFHTDGSPDNSFDGDGKITTSVSTGSDQAFGVAIQSDGKIVAAGLANNGSNNDIALVRYLANGTLDNSFGSAGIVTLNYGYNEGANTIAIQGDGKIVVAGYGNNGTKNCFNVLRFNTNGTLDNTFGNSGRAVTSIAPWHDEAHAIAIQPDNMIVVAGGSEITTGNLDFALVRYTANGVLDNSFGTSGKAAIPFPSISDVGRAMALQADGKIVVAGYIYNAGNYDFALVRYTTTGALDATFDGDGKVTTAIGASHEYAFGVGIQSDGKIVASGTTIAANNDFALVRYHPDGSLDLSFDGDGKAVYDLGNTDYNYRVALDGFRIYLAGVTNANGTDDFALTAIQNDAVALGSKLLSFSATQHPGAVQLNWQTAYEQNTLLFSVERSADNRSFVTIGTVGAAGHSTAAQGYDFTDAQPLASINYYRLKTVDADGNYRYSQTVAVKIKGGTRLEIFPNPAHDFISVQVTASTEKPLLVRDITGRVVKTVAVSGTGSVSSVLDISSLVPGTYFLTAGTESLAFVKQ